MWILQKALAVAVILVGASPVVVRAEATSPGEPAMTARERAAYDRIQPIDDRLIDASDPRVRIVFSQGTLEQAPNGTIVQGADRIPVSVLNDQARGSTDPVVLDLLARRCWNQHAGCDRVALLQRWVDADTQNMAAWISLSQAMKDAGNVDGARATFVRASQASMWHEHSDDLARSIVAAFPRDLTPDQRYVVLSQALSIAGFVYPTDVLQTIGAFCKENDAAVRAACVRIVDTMTRDSTSTIVFTVAPAYAARAGLTDVAIDTYQRRSDALHWSIMEATRTLTPANTMTLPDDVATTLSFLERRLQGGERGTAEWFLSEQRISETDAAKRYVAALNSDQLKMRADMRRRL